MASLIDKLITSVQTKQAQTPASTPIVTTTATVSAWDAIPAWLKVVGAGALAFAGCVYMMKRKTKPMLGAGRRKRSSSYAASAAADAARQKRMMDESMGREHVPTRPLVRAPGDYGRDPIGPNEAGVFMFRMHPSGDVVTYEESERRLRKK